MTSLRQQLASLHTKSINELDLKAQKVAHAKSLLFDPKVAANQSLDVIYQICYEGFEELCALDSRFLPFERSIFSQQSKAEDRLHMTQKENAKLDEVLEDFLGLVGARLLLKPAIKAVEWLVRRFRILESNTESLVLTFLPYHATPIFIALLSILPKQLPPALKFLHPYMARLTNPSRMLFVSSAARNAPFFAALNRYVLKVARAQNTYHILLSFWASTMAQTINDVLEISASGKQNIQRQREEDLLIRYLPVLDEGLGIRNAPELVLGCYMLITILVSKASLNDSTIDEIMSAVAKSRTPDTNDAALGCLAIIAEQRQGLVLPGNITETITRFPNLVEHMEELASQQPVQRLAIYVLQCALNRLLHKPTAQDLALLQAVFNSSILSPTQKDLLFQQMSHLTRTHTQIVRTSANTEQNLDGLLRFLEEQRKSTTLQNEIMTNGEDVESPPISEARSAFLTPNVETITVDDRQDVHASAFQHTSFLLPTSLDKFGKLLAVFEQSLRQQSTSEFLAQYFPAAASADQNLPFYSFFMRVCVVSRAKLAKCRALEFVTQRLKTSESGFVDYQTTIVYALYALADSSKHVRQHAANLVVEIDHYLAKEMMQGSEIQSQVAWAHDLYGSSSQVEWLSTKTASSFVNKLLVAGLEECISDASYVSRIIHNGLDNSLHSKVAESELYRDRLKAAQRSEVFKFLGSNVGLVPLYDLKSQILSMLNNVDKVGNYLRSKVLLPYILHLGSTSEADLALASKDEQIEISKLDTRMLEVVHPNDHEAIDFLLSLTKDNNGQSRKTLQLGAFQRLSKLWPLLKRSKQKSAIDILLDAALQIAPSSGPSTCQGESLRTLKSITIPSEILITLADQAVSSMNQGTPLPSSKKRRISSGDGIATGSQEISRGRINLGRLTLILELIDASRSEPNLGLVYSLFKILQVLHDYQAYTTSELGYLQNLTLGSLLTNVKEFNRLGQIPEMDRSLIRVDLLVHCVLNITSIQLALLLLAELTKYTPKAVLDSIMPIFTLMATTMQNSDEFSAYVVDQTIQQVIPLLSKTLREQKQDLATAAADILLSFAAAFEHIAPHRKLHLYTKLASSLGVSDSLFAMLATLFDRFPGNADVERFSVQLFRQFESQECFRTITNYLNLVLDCLQPERSLSRVLLRDDNSSAQLSELLTRLVVAIPNLLNDAVFRTKLAHDLAIGNNTVELRKLFSIALEQTIRLTQTTTQKDLTRTACTQLLESLLNLFPLEHLVESVQPLMDHSDQNITRSVLKVLEVRVRTSKHTSALAKSATIKLLSHLTHALCDETKSSLKSNVLACVDQICEKFGKTDPGATSEAAKVMASEHCVGSSDPIVRVLSLHCLASSVDILQNEFIPLLHRSVEAALLSLQTSLVLSMESSSLHDAAYAFFTALIDHLPFMVSRISLRAILEASHSSATANFDQTVNESRTQFLQLAATRLDLMMTLEVAKEVWNNAVQQGPQALREHVELLKTAIDSHSKAVVSRNAQTVFEVLWQILDLRRTCTDISLKQLYSDKQIDSLEVTVIACVISVVMKINDATFRPFFSRLFEWSAKGLPKRESLGRALRFTTVFKLVTALSEKLKSIFTVYFSNILDYVGEILQLENSTESSTQVLKTAVIYALTSSFKHDQDDFWQAPSRFDNILEPLVAQLSLQSSTNIDSDVIPAITEFSAAAASNDHHRDLNRLLLRALKADSPRVRLAAVKCQESLARRLGDEWLGHLPEMLPLINELQDDDDESVERETHRWIKLIENTLGESLNSMLQ